MQTQKSTAKAKTTKLTAEEREAVKNMTDEEFAKYMGERWPGGTYLYKDPDHVPGTHPMEKGEA
jgi:hypothetical protein